MSFKHFFHALAFASAVLGLSLFMSCEPEEEPWLPDDDDIEVPQEEEPLALAPARDTVFEAGGIMFNMIYVPSGTFVMGATTQTGIAGYDHEADPSEQPPHQVTLDAFLIGDVEVSQFLYFAVTGENPSLLSDLTYPVHNVSFTKAQQFVEKLSKMTGYAFRLPTEAEWEYAAKGGGQEPANYYYSGSNDADSVAWSSHNADDQLHVSSLLNPNALGIYDMSGNLMEWCTDWYGAYNSTPQTNPEGPVMPSNANLQKRAARGGSYLQTPYWQRNTARQFYFGSHDAKDIGLRVVISVGKN